MKNRAKTALFEAKNTLKKAILGFFSDESAAISVYVEL